MAIMWVTTAGLAICLGLVGMVFVHSLKGALHSDDATRIDSAQENEPNSK